MLKVFDFRCPECDSVEEHFIKDGEDVSCPDCSVVMTRLVATPRLDYKSFWLAGMESGDRWSKVRQQHQKRQERAKDTHGTYSHTGQRNEWDNSPEILSKDGERLKKVQ